MKRFAAYVLLISLLLGGCSWMDRSYASVTPHRQQDGETGSEAVVVHNYLQLRTALENMISSGTESGVINAGDFSQEELEENMEMAVRYAESSYPIGAYAVEDISYDIGTNGGVLAVAVRIVYLHDRTEIQKIQEVVNMDAARNVIGNLLTRHETGGVLLIDSYEAMDITQFVEDYAAEHPSSVMETPQVVAEVYPSTGKVRVLELKFTYQTSRESLRTMQTQVGRVFDSAALYVSSDAQDGQKFSQLYAFLMERFVNYQIKTSITPAYSLLNHGVGDSKAFATVFAEMCRQSGLECQVVVGTRAGEPWFWNMVLDGGYYYHVDLLDCWQKGSYQELTDNLMANYVWDYSAYPVCTGAPVVQETEAAEETTEPNAEDTTEPAEGPAEIS